MPYVQRNASGTICGSFANLQPGFGEEFVSDNDPGLIAFINSLSPQMVSSQDLLAQFTSSDIATITTAIAGNSQIALLWYSLLAQKDPMNVARPRFKAGWTALTATLGKPRMDAIATALGVTVT